MSFRGIKCRALLVGLEVGVDEFDKPVEIFGRDLAPLVRDACSMERSNTVSFC